MKEYLLDIPIKNKLSIISADLVKFICDDMIISGITIRAISSFTTIPPLYALAAQSPVFQGNTDARNALTGLIAFAQRDKEFSRKEIDREFVTIVSHHMVSIWAAIETAIERILVTCLLEIQNLGSSYLSNIVPKKISQAQVSNEKEAKNVIHRWESSLSDELVFYRYLEMLSGLNIKLSMEEDDVLRLCELGELRNILLHNKHIVDERFKEKCPWAPWNVDTNPNIGRKNLENYYDVAGKFGLLLLKETAKFKTT